MMKEKLLDYLLLPRTVYKKTSNSLWSLLIGIIYVGVADILTYLLPNGLNSIFSGKSAVSLTYNILVMISVVLFIGVLDVTFFSIPIFDIFKYLNIHHLLAYPSPNSKLDKYNGLIRLIKTYILARTIVIFATILVYLGLYLTKTIYTRLGASLLIIYLGLIIPIWLSTAIMRGIDTIYTMNSKVRNSIFCVVFVWGFLISSSIDYVCKWILLMFK